MSKHDLASEIDANLFGAMSAMDLGPVRALSGKEIEAMEQRLANAPLGVEIVADRYLTGSEPMTERDRMQAWRA
ncbi:hypothetical protein [Falsiroseomonas sp. CW058]|uniref:hypothetical protein n=1 Tax=Falsiroseomonas sp. CW058 TaxID=3388664 RepID=UPI003D317C25